MSARKVKELLCLLTVTEAQLLTGQPMNQELWMALGDAGASACDLQKLADEEFQRENTSALISLQLGHPIYPVRLPQVLRELVLSAVVDEKISLSVQHLEIAAGVFPRHARNRVTSAAELARVLAGLSERWDTATADTEKRRVPGLIEILKSGLPDVRTQPDGLVLLIGALTRLIPHLNSECARQAISAALGWDAPQVTERLWPAVQAAELEHDSGFLMELLDSTSGRTLALSHSPRLQAHDLPWEDALRWTETQRDALVWKVHAAGENTFVLTSPARQSADAPDEFILSIHEAARLQHLAWWQGWQDQDALVITAEGSTWILGAEQGSWMDAARRYPSPWFAKTLMRFDHRVMTELAEIDRSALIRLSMLHRPLLARLTQRVSDANWEEECRTQLLNDPQFQPSE